MKINRDNNERSLPGKRQGVARDRMPVVGSVLKKRAPSSQESTAAKEELGDKHNQLISLQLLLLSASNLKERKLSVAREES